MRRPQPCRDQMRMVLSYAAGYRPPPCRGGPRMDRAIDLVLEDRVAGFRIADVLLMCQDLGFKELMAHLLHHLWCQS